MREAELDGRAQEFDVDQLEAGDAVEVLIPSERQWAGGVIRTAGESAWIDVGQREPIGLADALAVGLRRVLH